MLIVDRLQLGSVEISGEVRLSPLGNPVKPVTDLLNQSVRGKLTTTVYDVVGSRAAQLVDRFRRQIALILQKFEDKIVCRCHPFRPVSHNLNFSCSAHNITDAREIDSHVLSNRCFACL